MLAVACQGSPGKDASALRGGETRATLSPAMFDGVTATAYQAAAEIPEVIDSLYCYCRCKENFNHKSLLTCFVDMHAAYCSICIEEAVMALDMHRKGADVFEIKKAVDERFKHLAK